MSVPRKLCILVDTREQLPYWNCNRTTLLVGDYTTKRLHKRFHIERKSLQDLYGTLIQGNTRFKRELFRAAYHQITICLYIEGTREDFINKRFPKGNERKFSTDGLDKLIKTFERVYYLQFHWHRNRAHSRREVEKRLQMEEKRLSSLKTTKNT